MKREYNVNEICKIHGCHKDDAKEVICQQLANEFPPVRDFVFTYPDDNTIVVDIHQDIKATERTNQ